MKKHFKDIFYEDFLENPTKDKFRDLLKNNFGELGEFDFKEAWIEKGKLAKLVLAMANSRGGVVIFGIKQKDDGTFEPVGLEKFKDDADINNDLARYISPNLYYEIFNFDYKGSEYEAVENKKFQVLIVNDTPDKLPFISLNQADGLTVLQELEYGTSNLLEDTDGDGLTDYDEIFIYGTDPLVADTDGDGLRDGDEIKLGLDPLKKDSDGDGIPDNEEKIEQILVEEIECEESGQITQVSVSMKGTGLIDNTTKIENTFGKDVLSSELVGLIGVPVDIESTSSFDTATIKFRYDEGLLGKTNEEDLRIMWYDEENNQYVIMDEETVLNTEEHLEITTNISTYLVVDEQMWYDVWVMQLPIVEIQILQAFR